MEINKDIPVEHLEALENTEQLKMQGKAQYYTEKEFENIVKEIFAEYDSSKAV